MARGTTDNHGVETGAAEDAGGTDEALRRLKLGFEIGLLLGSTGREGRAIVETLKAAIASEIVAAATSAEGYA